METNKDGHSQSSPAKFSHGDNFCKASMERAMTGNVEDEVDWGDDFDDQPQPMNEQSQTPLPEPQLPPSKPPALSPDSKPREMTTPPPVPEFLDGASQPLGLHSDQGPNDQSQLMDDRPDEQPQPTYVESQSQSPEPQAPAPDLPSLPVAATTRLPLPEFLEDEGSLSMSLDSGDDSDDQPQPVRDGSGKQSQPIYVDSEALSPENQRPAPKARSPSPGFKNNGPSDQPHPIYGGSQSPSSEPQVPAPSSRFPSSHSQGQALTMAALTARAPLSRTERRPIMSWAASVEPPPVSQWPTAYSERRVHDHQPSSPRSNQLPSPYSRQARSKRPVSRSRSPPPSLKQRAPTSRYLSSRSNKRRYSNSRSPSPSPKRSCAKRRGRDTQSPPPNPNKRKSAPQSLSPFSKRRQVVGVSYNPEPEPRREDGHTTRVTSHKTRNTVQDKQEDHVSSGIVRRNEHAAAQDKRENNLPSRVTSHSPPISIEDEDRNRGRRQLSSILNTLTTQASRPSSQQHRRRDFGERSYVTNKRATSGEHRGRVIGQDDILYPAENEWKQRMMQEKHEKAISAAKLLRTTTKPHLSYRPKTLSPHEQDTIDRQVAAAEAGRKRDLETAPAQRRVREQHDYSHRRLSPPPRKEM